MDLYVRDAVVALLETDADPTAAAITVHAWHLRQRDSLRALGLCARAERQFGAIAPQDRLSLQARIGLVRAEAAWLGAETGAAAAFIDEALLAFEHLGDAAGIGDSLLLRSRLADDQGEIDRRRGDLAAAAAAYAKSGDPLRALAASAWLALDETYAGSTGALDRAQVLIEQADAAEETALDGVVGFARALLAYMRGDYGSAAAGYQRASGQLKNFGLIRQSIFALISASAALGNLNDLQGQSDYIDRGLAEARERQWPLLIGSCLNILGYLHDGLGRTEDAKAAFSEARDRLRAFPRSRSYGVSGIYLGDMCLRLQQTDEALAAFHIAEGAARAGSHSSLIPKILMGKAACLSALNQPAEAIRLAQETLDEFGDLVPDLESEILWTLARIHKAHDLPPPAGAAEASGALHYLTRIWTRHSVQAEWRPGQELLGALSEAWEATGDLVQALHFERLRSLSVQDATTQRAGEQATALQARLEAETARMEANHQRSLAELNKGRLSMLSQLGTIGQELTSTHDLTSIFQAVERHIGELLDAAAISVWLLEGDQLVPGSAWEEGRPILTRNIPVTDTASVAARVARERREFLIDYPVDGSRGSRFVPGTRRMRTALFAPLLINERLLGVMSVQSAQPDAYGEEERLIFRSVCVQSAVALGNALSYRELAVANDRLRDAQIALERLVSRDALTGLFSRRYIMEAAETEIARARREKEPLSVMMIDLDHFKQVNDRHGHAAGDAALQAVALMLTRSLRPTDIIARYGGEELVALLPGTDLADAIQIAGRARAAIAAERLDLDGVALSVTASFGIAEWVSHELSIEQALKRADIALYSVKQRGRNAVAARGYGASSDDLDRIISV
ncbi:MAG TPA: sensor domain-containing diguanylate cyclase [Aliidongia sp.]|uniref:sensor domain-containing diguanylate cyclase n=1 Tax=Aliidongia sp. TaxID=1914230 RepID=UPI002DDCF658|nr:sensor domain-containing diguanylate cyclase [Aliidongia sp.]HEV2672902.1 sensor domain-containing diguanylate cyclase [Aliidongia sp.]